MENAGGTYEFFVITTVVNTYHVQVRRGSLQGTVFEVGNPIVPVVGPLRPGHVQPGVLVALMTRLGVEFTEVRS